MVDINESLSTELTCIMIRICIVHFDWPFGVIMLMCKVVLTAKQKVMSLIPTRNKIFVRLFVPFYGVSYLYKDVFKNIQV